jgi:hypothetical protein
MTTSADLDQQAADTITVLTTRGPILTKQWLADGTIKGHDQAKHHTVEEFPLENLDSLALLLSGLQLRTKSCVIRGQYIGDERAKMIPDPERKGGFVLRRADYFDDVAHHWVMFDLDRFTPLSADPVLDPENAFLEWVETTLPVEFHGVSFVWQLSSSAGHASKAGTLRGHVWFWMRRPMTSPEAHAWVTMNKLEQQVDRAPMNVVQAHYTANPVMGEGVADPVPCRVGVCPGYMGDVVDVAIDEGALAVAVASRRKTAAPGTGEGEDYPDPRQKKGVIGAFCRAFSVEDVLTADWFQGNFVKVTDRRWTWDEPGHPPEGAFISEDGLQFVSSHNTAPCDTHNRALNAYDLARVYNFGELDDAVPEEDRWTLETGPMNLPSDEAMRKFARTLPEVQAELEAASDAKNPFVQAHAEETAEAAVAADEAAVVEADIRGKGMVKKITGSLHALGVGDDDIKKLIDGKVLKAAWDSCFYEPAKQKLVLLNKDGALVLFAQADWAKMVHLTFGSFINEDAMKEILPPLSEATGEKLEVLDKELRKMIWSQFEAHVKLYRQRTEAEYVVDPFASKASVRAGVGKKAIITYTLPDLPTQKTGLSAAMEQSIVDEYRQFFPFFDTLIDLLLHARFAADRRQAYLWMQCIAGWGKGFLFDGVLGKDGLGLVTAVSVKDIERAFEGSPSGVPLSAILYSWCIWIDEFKSVKGEIKMLNNVFTAAPKGQMQYSIPIFLKAFTSAEDVESLAGSAGVESQFADRFALVQMDQGSVDKLEMFKKYGKYTCRLALANYVAGRLNEGITWMRALGRAGAAKVSDEWLAQFHIDHGILKTHELLTDSIDEIVDEIREMILASATGGAGLSHINSRLKEALGSIEIVVGGMHRTEAESTPSQLAVVRHLPRLVNVWIDTYISKSQQPTVRVKADRIVRALGGAKNESRESKKQHSPWVRYWVKKEGGAETVKIRGAVFVVKDAATFAEETTAFDNVLPFTGAK